MADAWTKINLDEVEDAAPGNGFGKRWEARGAREPLDASDTGLTHFAIRVGPEVPRAFEAGPGGLEFIAFGAYREADGEPVEDDWVE